MPSPLVFTAGFLPGAVVTAFFIPAVLHTLARACMGRVEVNTGTFYTQGFSRAAYLSGIAQPLAHNGGNWGFRD